MTNPRLALSLPAAVLAAATSLPAQPYFHAPWRTFEVQRDELDAERQRCVAVGDLDGNGWPDLVVGQSALNPPGFRAGREGVSVQLSEGPVRDAPATFETRVFYPTRFDVVDVALADLDSDNDLDCAAASYFNEFSGSGGNLALLINRGDGTFEQPVYRNAGALGATSVTAADLNGDGHVDLVLTGGGNTGTVSVLLNLQGGQFGERQMVSAAPGELLDSLACDFDGDGDLDVAAAYGGPGEVLILANDGSANLSIDRAYRVNNLNNVPEASIAAADADLDGDIDLYFTPDNNSLRTSPGLAVLRNDGNGAFEVEHHPYQTAGTQEAFDVAVADLDGDGYPDALGGEFFGIGLLVSVNDGDGSFLPVRRVPSADDVSALATADLDLDGDPDAVAVNELLPTVAIHANPGDGEFAVVAGHGRGASHQLVKLGDLDGDGIVDAVTSHTGTVSSTVNVLHGMGDGTFVESYVTPAARYGFARFADLDGDGFDDLLFASGPGAPPYEFYTARSRGDGTFEPTATWPMQSCGNAHPVAADLDGDGDLDVVLTEDRSCFGGIGTVLYARPNLGDGTFGPRYTIPSPGRSENAVPTDFDRDGDIDLLVLGTQPHVLFGHGNGTFAAARMLPAYLASYNARVEDFDGDGHLDIAGFGDLTAPTGTGRPLFHLLILWGDSTGFFVPQPYGNLPDIGPGNWLEGGDLDLDGDTDLVVDGTQDAYVFVNAGSRDFEQAGRYGIGADPHTAHVADTDGDGFLDLLAVGRLTPRPAGGGDGLLVVPGAPWRRLLPCSAPLPDLELFEAGVPTLGSNVSLRIDDPTGRTGVAAGSPTVLVLSAARVPGPCGLPLLGYGPGSAPAELFLDPSAPWVATPVTTWGGPGAPAAVQLTIPANPAMIGRSVFVQGLIGGNPGGDLILTTALQMTVRA